MLEKPEWSIKNGHRKHWSQKTQADDKQNTTAQDNTTEKTKK